MHKRIHTSRSIFHPVLQLLYNQGVSSYFSVSHYSCIFPSARATKVHYTTVLVSTLSKVLKMVTKHTQSPNEVIESVQEEGFTVVHDPAKAKVE